LIGTKVCGVEQFFHEFFHSEDVLLLLFMVCMSRAAQVLTSLSRDKEAK
jgi:hypothetical protein